MTTEIIQAWTRYEKWLRKEYPPLAALLRPPASDAQLESLQKAFPHPLPPDVVALWKLHDGQSKEEVGVLADFQFLSVKDALAEWRMWAEVRASNDFKRIDKSSRSFPPGAIQCAYSRERWLPLWKEYLEANYLGVDFAPAEKGTVGQIINFGRDEADKAVIAPSLTGAIQWLAAEAEAGRIVKAEDEYQEDEDKPVLRPVHPTGRVLTVLMSQVRERWIPSKRKGGGKRPP